MPEGMEALYELVRRCDVFMTSFLAGTSTCRNWPTTPASPPPNTAPGFAEQTDEILSELGLGWDRIITLKSAGAVT